MRERHVRVSGVSRRPVKRLRSTILFHRTTSANAKAILAGGFKDGTGSYLTDRQWKGVWLSNVPLDCNEGAVGDTLLEVTLDLAEADLADYEWIEEGKGYREWLVPARLINSRMKVRVVDD